MPDPPSRRMLPWMGILLALLVLVGGGLVAAGTLGGAAFSFSEPSRATDLLPAGTSRVLQVDAGSYLVFGIGPTRADARKVEVVIFDESGAVVDQVESHDSFDSSGAKSYEQIAEVRIPADGRYGFRVSGPPGTMAALGHAPERLFWTLVIVAVVIALASVVLAVALLTVSLVVIVRRERRRRVGAPSIPPPPPPPLGG